MTEEKEYSGSMTAMDGTRVMLTPAQAKAMWEDCERIDAERAKTYPDSLACLRAMSSAEERLKQLGWRDGRYCPRDGSTFATCQVGSTGMWKGFWSPDSGSDAFPQGYIISADCVHRPSEMYFKPLDKLTDEEAALIAKCDADVAVMIEEAGKMLEALTLSDDGSAE
jgi:hypothetical protein